MPRIKPLTKEEAAPEAQASFDANMKAFGQVLNTTAVYAYRPTIQAGAGALGRGINESGLIPARLRSLINVRIAGQVGCVF
ncbi:MAG TPA: hypothetical protein VFS62_01145 [Chloroflexota bacterium]|nr:hypothetical protein [Chloroflexota bacterium]